MLLVCAALPAASWATPLSITWQGGESGTWHEPSHWSPAVVPGVGDGSEEHAATISSAAVALGNDATLASLFLEDTTLSGGHALTCSGPGLTLSGENVFSADLSVVVLGPLGFSAADASLTNHGSLRFGPSDPLLLPSPGSTGTLTNATDGIILFTPATVIEPPEGELPLPTPLVVVGAPASFRLVNEGDIRADDLCGAVFYAYLEQTTTGRLLAQGSSSLTFWAGGTISGSIELDAAAQVQLGGLTLPYEPYAEPSVVYALNQTSISGGGFVQADRVILSGSLAAGALRAEDCLLEDEFDNHGELTLSYTRLLGDLVNQPGAFLRWLYGTSIPVYGRFTNRGTLQFGPGNIVYGSLTPPYVTATIENTIGGLLRFDPDGTGQVGSWLGTPRLKIENAGILLSDNLPVPAYNFPNEFRVPVRNTGLIRVTAGSALRLSPTTFVQASGETRVEDSELHGDGTNPLTFAAGLVRATGTLFGPVSLGPEAALEIGLAQASGTLNFTSSLTLSPGSEVRLDLGSIQEAGGHDCLLVSGQLQLDGRLVIRTAPELTATLGPEHRFPLVTAGTIAGAFSNVHAGRVRLADGSGSFQVLQTATTLTLGDYRAATPFEIWQQSHWPAAEDSLLIGPDADPDADGLPNLLEYALNGDPAAPQTTAWCHIEVAAARLHLTFVPRVTPGLSYSIESSDDLETWQATALEGVVADAPYTYADTVELTPGQSRFLRLLVSLSPEESGE